MTIPLLEKSSTLRTIHISEEPTRIIPGLVSKVTQPLVDTHGLMQLRRFEKPLPLGTGTLPASVSHRAHQTEWPVSQRARGTCWAFAGISALEAAYDRRGTRVDLSQNYLFSMMKSWGNAEVTTPPVFTSSLVGFQGAADVVHHLAMLRVPLRTDAPYLDQVDLQAIGSTVPQIPGGPLPESVAAGTPERIDWFEYDYALTPLRARWRARYGVKSYGTAPLTVDGIKRVVAAGYDAVIDVYDQVNQGGHVVLVYGYDDATREFLIKNSQPAPPASPFQRMKYDGSGQFRIAGKFAFFITEVREPSSQRAAAWIGRWSMDHGGETGRLVIRAIADMWREDLGMPDASSPISLGTYYGPGGQAVPVHGWFSDGGRVMKASIGREKFTLALHSSELDRASGTYNDGKKPRSGGVTLSRGVPTGGTSAPPVNRGTWDVDVDGVRMTLNGSPSRTMYDAATGDKLPVNVYTEHPDRMNLSFRSGKGVDLHAALVAHQGEPALLSGLVNETTSPLGATATLAASFYLVRPDGSLDWAQHSGRHSMAFEWQQRRGIGSGWNMIRSAFGGGGGRLYVIRQDGTLDWFLHRDRESGGGYWLGPSKVGKSWQTFAWAGAGEGGLIYALTTEGSLLWYRHLGLNDGTFRWDGPHVVATGWDAFRSVTAAPDGVFYALTRDGYLLWYRHWGRDYGTDRWEGPRVVGEGWGEIDRVFATGSGYLYGRFADDSSRSQELWEWQHTGFRDGEFAWRGGAKVGIGWGPGNVVDVLTS